MAQPLFQSLGWALIHFIWQGALIALLYLSLRFMLRRQTANVRYAVSCAALVLMFLLPVAGTFMIDRNSPGVSISNREFAYDADNATAASRPMPEQVSNSESSLPASAVSDQSVPLQQRIATMMPWLIAVWLLGVSLLSIRVMGGWIVAQRIKRRQSSDASLRWQEMLTSLTERLRVSRPVRLCESFATEVPTVIGWLRPVILVPATALTGLTAQQIEALLAHELAHIRRYDYLVNLLQTVVETLLFYHPAVWWISREIRIEREHCCDDLAVEACGNVLTYARALASLEEIRVGAIPQLAVAANGGSLLARIKRLVETPSSPHQGSNAFLASVVAFAAMLVICAGAGSTLLANETGKETLKQGATALLEKLAAVNPVNLLKTQDDKPAPTPAPDVIVNGINERVSVRAPMPDDPDAMQDEDTPGTPAAPPAPRPGLLEVGGMTLGAPTLAPVAVPGVAPVAPDGASMYTVTPRPAPPAWQDYDDEDEDTPGQSYIDSLAAEGYSNLTIDQLVDLRNHGVSARFIKELKAAGYTNISVDMLIRLRDHGVSGSYVAALASAGYKGLPLEDLIRARDHGVTTGLIESLQAAGFSNLPLEMVIRTVDHGVGRKYIEEMKALGFSGLTLEQLVRMRDHGVDAGYVREIREAGYNNLTIEEFIRLRNHGISGEFIKKARARGFTNLSISELTKLRDADVLD